MGIWGTLQIQTVEVDIQAGTIFTFNNLTLGQTVTFHGSRTSGLYSQNLSTSAINYMFINSLFS